MVIDVIGNYFMSIETPLKTSVIDKRIEKIILKYSTLANFIALLGGKIKQKQMISGYMADILSDLFLVYNDNYYTENILIRQNLTFIHD